MKHFFILLSTLFIMLSVRAQNADEIINKYLEATGGKSLWAKVTSIKATGSYIMGPGMKAPINFIKLNKPFLGNYSDFSWQGMTSKTVLRDTAGWSYNPFGGKREIDPLSPDRIRSIKLDADPQGLLYNYKEKKCTVEYLGMDDFDGVDVYKLRLTNSKGDMVYYYIDATSNFILKTEEKIRLAEKEETNITVFSDFRKTSYGIYYPYTMQSLDDQGNESGGPIELSKVEFNTTIDASQFDASSKK